MSLLEIRDLHYTYPDGHEAVKGLSFSVEKGEFVALLGANGSGKTTLLKHLNGLTHPSSGGVYFNGELVESVSKNQLFSKIGLVFQDPNDQLFAATVGEDVAFGPGNMRLSAAEIKERVSWALEAVGMAGTEHRPIHALSYGQKKRICIAGILAMKPEVLVLDEPTSGLDPAGVRDIMRMLRHLNVDMRVTLVMATHSVDLVPVFHSKVVVLSEGKVVLAGSPSEVFAQPAVLRAAHLRLPRIGHLMDVLKKKDNFPIDDVPQTLQEARRELVRIVKNEEIEGSDED
ncbi:MAG: ATP-binding cassette domain-containing protein [Nitrospirota bacterium]|nr:ATP-binding cassette domain-containing protein [Nitrospirota bacterium]